MFCAAARGHEDGADVDAGPGAERHDAGRQDGVGWLQRPDLRPQEERHSELSGEGDAGEGHASSHHSGVERRTAYSGMVSAEPTDTLTTKSLISLAAHARRPRRRT